MHPRESARGARCVRRVCGSAWHASVWVQAHAVQRACAERWDGGGRTANDSLGGEGAARVGAALPRWKKLKTLNTHGTAIHAPCCRLCLRPCGSPLTRRSRGSKRDCCMLGLYKVNAGSRSIGVDCHTPG